MKDQATDRIILDLIRAEAEKKYARRFKVLARRLGWSSAKLSRLLSGGQSMRVDELCALCAVLALPVSQLLRVAGA